MNTYINIYNYLSLYEQKFFISNDVRIDSVFLVLQKFENI